MPPAIAVQGLRKSYGGVERVHGISFEVEAGEIVGLLGTNGAGKTTTIEILEGYRPRSGGQVSVLGTDPARGGRAWRDRVGLVLQECELDPVYTVRETVSMFSRYFSRATDVVATIGHVGLADKIDERIAHLSGGQKRRVDVALGLIGGPEVLFLDEPTTGLDPAARREMWAVVKGLRDVGKTVLLTTHYMDEAEHLADRIIILQAGKIAAEGTPDELSRSLVKRTEVSFTAADGTEPGRLSAALKGPGRGRRRNGAAVVRQRSERPSGPAWLGRERAGGTGRPPGQTSHLGRRIRPDGGPAGDGGRRGAGVVNQLALAGAQARYALRGFLRNPRAFVFTMVLPVFLLVLFNATFGGGKISVGFGAPATYYTAAVVAYAIMQSSFSSLVISVTAGREAGLLKRFRGTPMPSWVYLAAEIGRTVVVAAATVAVLVAAGVVFYGVNLSARTLVGLGVYVVAGTASLCALGLAVTRACATTDAASAVGPFSTVVLSFLSGVFIPAAVMPSWLLDIGKAFPLEHLAQGLRAAFLVPGSTGITATNLGAVLAWGAAGLILALRTFRWEPLASAGK